MAYVLENSEWSIGGGAGPARALSEFTAHRTRPFYLYDLDDVDERLRSLKADFAARIHYAVKANADPRVLACVRDAGAGVDVVSLGEMQRALEAGIPADRIIFSGVAKDREDLGFAMSQRVYQINVESFEELKFLGALARERHATPDIGLRVNINLTAPTHHHIQTATETSKFGIDLKLLPEVLDWIRSRPQLRLKGLAVHIGSQILDVTAFEKMSEQMGQLYRELRGQSFDIKRLDLGGGLGVDYADGGEAGDAARLELYKRAIGSHGTDAELSIEPGRWLTARMGVLMAKVVYVKQGAHAKFLILNAGMTALMRPALYQAYHRIEPIHPRSTRETYTVVGPVCESTDVFAEHRELPTCEAGDWVAIFEAGAYGAVMASTYNETPVPERWSLRRGRVEVIA